MKIQFLGTAAAEAIPALFCRCNICKTATERGGKEIRRRAAVMVNDHLLIDLGPDIYMQKIEFRLDLASVDNMIFTHSHSDHLDADELCFRDTNVYAHIENAQPVKLYGNEKVCQVIRSGFQFDFGKDDNDCFLLNEIGYESQIIAGELRITALPAEHDQREKCMIYLLQESGGANHLYANDTGTPKPATIQMLKKHLHGELLSGVSMDCTFAASDSTYSGHMGFAENLLLRDTLIEAGVADERTKWISTHFSHNGGWNYEEMSELTKKENFTTAWDGMIIEL